MSEIEWFVKGKLGGKPVGAAQGVGLEGRTRIGSDEAGKGDFFGPLVVAGVLVTQETEPLLLKAGVKDSKLVRSEQGIRRLSKAIRDVVKKDGYDIVMIGPARYNELYEKLGNMNSILGWAHARVIENLLKRHGECNLAVADQFGDEEHIRRALMAKGKEITLIQIPKGERDLAVAAASILARDRFLYALNRLHEEFDIELPRGSGKETREAGEHFAKRYGKDALKNVAKLHFSIHDRIP